MTEDKIFTQADVDRIIGERLARARTEADEQIAKLTKDFADEKLSHLKDKVFSETKLPETLRSFVTGEDEDSIRQQVNALITGMGPGPNVGGSSNPAGGNTSPHIYTKSEIEKMSPDDINKDWTNIQKQLASGQIK